MGVAVSPLATFLNAAACQPNSAINTNKNVKAGQQMGTAVCATCGELGHSRKTSKLCKMRVKKICKKCGGEGHERASHKECKYFTKKNMGP